MGGVKVTLPSGTQVTCSPEQAKRYQAASESKKAPAKKAASSKKKSED